MLQGYIIHKAQVVVLVLNHSLPIFLGTNRTQIIMIQQRTLATTTMEVPPFMVGLLLLMAVLKYPHRLLVEASQQVITDTNLPLLRPIPFLV